MRESAERLGLVTLEQMAESLRWAVENPPEQSRVLDVPAIRLYGSIPAPRTAHTRR